MPRRTASNDRYSDPEKIELFLRRGQELWDSRARRDGLKVSFRIDLDIPTRGAQYRSSEPDSDDLTAYLTRFRRFIADGSPVFLPVIFKICNQSITDSECLSQLQDDRAYWKELCRGSETVFTLTIDGRTYATQDIVDLWLNGHYFHDDAAKVQIVDNLDPFIRSASRKVFLHFVIETTKLIRHLATIIHFARERNAWVPGARVPSQ